MKTTISLFFILVSINFYSQDLVNKINNRKPSNEYDNIYIQKLSSDSLASTFVIWIKKKVKLHKHINHTENVIIQQGSGKFQLNDSIYMVSSGDMITIPKNTWHGVVTTSKVPMKVISIQSPEFLGKDRVFKN